MKKNFVLIILAIVLLAMPMTAIAAEEAKAPEKVIEKTEAVVEKVEEKVKEDEEKVKEEVKKETEKVEEKVEEVVKKVATPAGEKVKLDGKDIKIDAYLIDGENYLKLRDVAALLKETKAKFKVAYDAEKDKIKITLGEAHDEDFVAPAEDAERANKTGVPSYQPILDAKDKAIELKGYLIDGNNYFRLRDLGKKLGFGVAYDFVKGVVLLDSENLELADVPHETKFETPVNKIKTDAGEQDIKFLIYGFDECPHCANLKAYLDGKEIKYTMYDIRRNEDKKAEVYKEFYSVFNEGREKPYERVYYPTHVITLEKDGKSISKGVLGFNQENYDEIFEQIKTNKYFK
ncbi:MAG: glutaredoxin domain-containing protein [Neofamilia sp.]